MKSWCKRLVLSFAVAALGLVGGETRAEADKLRDLAEVAGARENQLLGYGVVTGLAGTGDDTSAPFAAQSMQAMLARLGLKVDSTQLKLRNVAAVVVTATLPAFSKPGTKIDVTIASIGNAKSLSGGVLVQTMLKGADQKTYAVAQGNLLLGGFSAKGASGSSVSTGTMTVARIPEGAIVEREVGTTFVDGGKLRLELRTPSFSIASAMVDAIDHKFGAGSANAPDGGMVSVLIPKEWQAKPVAMIAALEELDVTPVRRARVIINEKTGTVVASGDVRLSPVAVVHGNLTIVIKESKKVSQPAPLSKGGKTVVVPKSEVEVKEEGKGLKYVPAAPTLADVAGALGSLALSPRDLASVLSALRSAGALEAEVVIQ
jgi:flagellar P-ring protein precursor FlgI